MKKFTYSLLGLIGLLGLTSQSLADTHDAPPINQPSFGFVQETAAITRDGAILVDLYNTTSYPNMIRLGAFGGEVMIDASGDNESRGIGYKLSISNALAAYGMLYLDTDASYTNLTVGAAYSMMAGGFILNANADLFSQSDTTGGGGASETFFDLRGSAFYPVTTDNLKGSLSLGVELDLQISPDSLTDIYLGARWQAKPNVLLDLGLFESIDNSGVSTLGTPAFIRLNIGF